MVTVKPKSKGIVSWPKNERPRERLLAEGPERMTDADLLAVILRIGSGTFKAGVRGTSAYEAALSILKEFRGLRGLDRAHVQDLLKKPGLGPAKVAQIKAAFELGKRLCAGKLTAASFDSSAAVAAHFRPLFTGKRQEFVIAVFLNGQNQYFVGSAGQQRVPTSFLEDLVLPLPPLAVQGQIMELVAAGRAEIARERDAADCLARNINAEVEALILGTKKVSDL